jgi:hypothetical protein
MHVSPLLHRGVEFQKRSLVDRDPLLGSIPSLVSSVVDSLPTGNGHGHGHGNGGGNGGGGGSTSNPGNAPATANPTSTPPSNPPSGLDPSTTPPSNPSPDPSTSPLPPNGGSNPSSPPGSSPSTGGGASPNQPPSFSSNGGDLPPAVATGSSVSPGGASAAPPDSTGGSSDNPSTKLPPNASNPFGLGPSATVGLSNADPGGVSSGNNGNPFSDTPGPSGGPSSRHGLSPGGAIAVVVVVTLAIIVLLFFVLRRRAIRKRNEQRKRWFTNFGGVFGLRNSGTDQATMGSGTRSARSSFGPSYDHGLTPGDPDFVAPSLPPMAEIIQRNSPSEIPTAILVNTGTNSNRSSLQSLEDKTARASLAPSVYSQQDMMSVRPFTPTEAFAFPTPPLRPDTNDSLSEFVNSYGKRTKSYLATPPGLEPPAAAYIAGLPPNSPLSPSSNAPLLPPQILATNPFDDPNNYSNTPAEVEVVQQPFMSSLPDELSVQPGDSVKIVKTFSDGWAMIEKDGVGGLIPINCFREVGQGVPAFLASERVSSCHGSVDWVEEAYAV